MKKLLTTVFLTLFLSTSFVGCSKVQPNEIGVLITNYGADPVKDYNVVYGKVINFAPSTTLYTMPGQEQRSEPTKAIINKSSNGTEFTVLPSYSYRIDPKQATTVIRKYSGIFKEEGSDTSKALDKVEKDSLNPAINDVIKQVLQNTSSEELMSNGGNARFSDTVRKQVERKFLERGFTLLSFSTSLDYSTSVKQSIDARNKADSEISTLDSRILQAKKETELTEIQAKNAIVRSNSITDQELKLKYLEKWDGKLPTVIVADKNTATMLNIPGMDK